MKERETGSEREKEGRKGEGDIGKGGRRKGKGKERLKRKGKGMGGMLCSCDFPYEKPWAYLHTVPQLRGIDLCLCTAVTSLDSVTPRRFTTKSTFSYVETLPRPWPQPRFAYSQLP